MVNLLSNDVNRFDVFVLYSHYLWVGPLQLLIVTAILYQKIGISTGVGAALLVAAVPLHSKNIFAFKPLLILSKLSC